MATIEKTKLQLNLESIELNLFIASSIQEFRNSQNDNQYTIDFESTVNEAFIKADKLHFSNLIFNILDNAFKYCTIAPYVIIRLKDINNRYVLEFDDNGIGIPKNYRKLIFNRFYRIPTGNVHDVKGFGLGLDYVKKIIERHDWSIKVIENSRKGSTFIVEINKFIK
jgi:two-component system phosphate regulon sensor histidine kinase PhoR